MMVPAKSVLKVKQGSVVEICVERAKQQKKPRSDVFVDCLLSAAAWQLT